MMPDRKLIPAAMVVLLSFFTCHLVAAQVNPESRIGQIARQISGHVGVYALVLETGEFVSYHGNQKFPMQSVYKFPIGMAALNRVDKGEFSLNQKIQVVPSEYVPPALHSPLRDKYPGGVAVSLKQLLRYSVEESDGSASDVLLRLLGGAAAVEQYIRGLGIKNMAIATTEKEQAANDTVQYQNWTTPEAMSKLFGIFYKGGHLSAESRELLLSYLSPSSIWFNRRIKGLLPPGTPVVHKTGTSVTSHGLTRATNDAGIITLPNGKHLALSVFISDSYAFQKDRENVIARISKLLFDHFGSKKP